MSVFTDTVLWGSAVAFGGGIGHWWYCVGQSLRISSKEAKVPIEDTQTRVLTVGENGKTVQKTVDECPSKDIRVISEQDTDIEGAKVHVVPDDYKAEATCKGRALEWARNNVPRTSSYTLFIDEDTLVEDSFKFPEGDIIQLQEKPYETKSKLAYLVDRLRIGTTKEMDGFEKLKYPLYTWGGGLIIRGEVEDEVGWDVDTICEDTSFSVRAANNGYGYMTIDEGARNQSPPSIRALLKQRRRWAAGTYQVCKHMSRRWTALVYARMVGWIASVTAPFVTVWSIATNSDMNMYYEILAVMLAFAMLVWVGVSSWRYREHKVMPVLVLLLTPILLALNGAGALWGTIDRPDGFDVTKKVD